MMLLSIGKGAASGISGLAGEVMMLPRAIGPDGGQSRVGARK